MSRWAVFIIISVSWYIINLKISTQQLLLRTWYLCIYAFNYYCFKKNRRLRLIVILCIGKQTFVKFKSSPTKAKNTSFITIAVVSSSFSLSYKCCYEEREYKQLLHKTQFFKQTMNSHFHFHRSLDDGQESRVWVGKNHMHLVE